MSIQGQLVCIVICWVLFSFYYRGFLNGAIHYQLNLSAYKKRKKGQSIKEWLLYSRFKEELPKTFLLLHYFMLILHPSCMIVCILLYIIEMPLEVGASVVKTTAIFDAACDLIIALLFWSPGRDYAYDRWITKKRGQPRKRK